MASVTSPKNITVYWVNFEILQMQFWSALSKLFPNFLFFYPYSHCVKSVRIRSFPGPYFPAFGLNTEKYGDCLEYVKLSETIHSPCLCNISERRLFCSKILNNTFQKLPYRIFVKSQRNFHDYLGFSSGNWSNLDHF